MFPIHLHLRKPLMLDSYLTLERSDGSSIRSDSPVWGIKIQIILSFPPGTILFLVFQSLFPSVHIFSPIMFLRLSIVPLVIVMWPFGSFTPCGVIFYPGFHENGTKYLPLTDNFIKSVSLSIFLSLPYPPIFYTSYVIPVLAILFVGP